MITAKIRPPLTQIFDPVNFAKKKIAPYATGAYKKIGAECLNGKVKIGLLVYVESPNEFYVQINDFADDFKKIVTDMNDYYCRTVAEEFKLADYNKGFPCAAQYSEDGVWYRGKVKTYSAKSRMVGVFFVDYGNEDVVHADEAKFLKNDFFLLPSLAIRCRLSNVRPKSTDREYSAESKKDLESFIGQPLTINFLKLDEDQYWQVDLLTENAGNSLNSICSRFIQKGYAEAYESSSSSGKKPFETMKKHSAVDLPNGFPLPDVSYDDDAADFIVTVVNFRSLDEFYVTRTEDIDRLTTFELSLSHIYDTANVRPCSKPLQINSGCVINFNNTWCRCEILEMPTGTHQNSYRVLRVDYGEDCLVNADCVYPVVHSVDDLVSKTARFAFCCKMKGVKMPKDFKDRRELLKMMNNMGDNRVCKVYGADENSRFIVDLFLKNGSTLASFLLQSHVAVYESPAAASNSGDLRISPIVPMPKSLALANIEPPPSFNEPSPIINAEFVQHPGETIMQVAELPLLKIHAAQYSYLDVFILNVESPNKFYVLLGEHLEQFKKLEEDLSRIYGNGDLHAPLVSPVNGNFCVGKLPNESKWRRCLINSRISPFVIEVLFVDYGRSERIAKNELRIIDNNSFRTTPPLAVECSLNGVDSSERTTSEFKKIVENDSSSFVLRIDNKTTGSTSFEVTLYLDDKTPKMIDLNERLKRFAGHARGNSTRNVMRGTPA